MVIKVRVTYVLPVMLLALCLPTLVQAATAMLRWNPSAHATAYHVYYGQASRAYTVRLDVGPATSASVDGFAVGETWYFAATASNDSGESDYSNEGILTFQDQPPEDTTPPTVAISAPLDGQTVQRKGWVTIVAAAQDDMGVAMVELYVNDVLLCARETTPYSCSWKVPAAPNRQYTLIGVAVDTSGNSTTSGPVHVTSH